MLDMVVVGGGYVGLAVAVATKQAAPHLSIEVVEAAPRDVWRKDARASAIIAAAKLSMMQRYSAAFSALTWRNRSDCMAAGRVISAVWRTRPGNGLLRVSQWGVPRTVMISAVIAFRDLPRSSLGVMECPDFQWWHRPWSECMAQSSPRACASAQGIAQLCE